MRDPKESIELRCEMAKAAAPYLHARRAPEDKGGNTVPAMIYVHPISRSRNVASPEITYKDFSRLAKKRGWKE